MRKLHKVLAILALSGAGLGLAQTARAADSLTLVVSGSGYASALSQVHGKYYPWAHHHDHYRGHAKHYRSHRHYRHDRRGHGRHWRAERHAYAGRHDRRGHGPHRHEDRHHARDSHSDHGRDRRRF